MPNIFLDTETFYSHGDFSLSKMSTEEYCRDERCTLELFGLALEDGPVKMLDTPTSEQLDTFAKVSATPGVVCVAHNARFDGMVFGVRGIHPVWHCTMAMSLACGIGRVTGASLKSLTKSLGGPEKGGFIADASGKRLMDMTPYEQQQYRDYCAVDIEALRHIHKAMLPLIPPRALDFIAMTVRMYTDPLVIIDKPLLVEYAKRLEDELERDMAELQRLFKFNTKEEFISAIRSRTEFPKMLRSLGVEPPTKLAGKDRLQTYKKDKARIVELLNIPEDERDKDWVKDLDKAAKSVAKGARTFALAKSDTEFIELMEGDDEDVALLCQVRANNNSSIKMSRTQRLLELADRGPLPIPLSAFKARTGRFTAGNMIEDTAQTDSLNLQNFPRRQGDTTLRRSLTAPKGWKFVYADSSQIEARVGAWICQQNDLMEQFRRGECPYCALGEVIYNIDRKELWQKAKVEKIKEFNTLRDISKEGILSAQYGVSAKTFGLRLRQKKTWLKEPGDIEAHNAEADRIIKIYNAQMSSIAGFRRLCGKVLKHMCAGGAGQFGGSNGAVFQYDGDYDLFGHRVARVLMPNGFPIIYQNLRMETEKDDDGELRQVIKYDHWRGRDVIPIYIYGSKFYENLTQSLSFQILWHQALDIDSQLRRPGRIVTNEHDSWTAGVLEEDVDYSVELFERCMRQTPVWMPEALPLDCESGVGDNFAEL